MKKIILFFFALFCFLKTTPVFAEFFYIDNYDININVNKNKTLDITENIDVYFTQPRHGIFRTIPYIYTITRSDGTTEKTKSKISNIQINESATKHYENNSLVIKIGNPEKTISGYKTYRIKYNYSIPKPKKLKNNDEFYFNIIGNGWNTNINNVHFRISMPEEFDKNLIGFSIGERGAEGYDKGKLHYHIKNNIIEGDTSNLNENEGLTVRIELPKNYFKYESSLNKFLIFSIIILAILTLFSFFIWQKVGKDDPIIPVVGFEPPKDLNSALVGAYYREKADNKDIVSLIIQLASKGYIKIENSKIDDNDFIFHKLKPHEDVDSYGYKLMKAMFSDDTTVSLDDLKESNDFYTEVESLKSKLSRSCKKLYTPESLSFSSNHIPVLSAALSAFCIMYSVLDYDLSRLNPEILFISIWPIVAMVIFVLAFRSNPIVISIWSLGFGGIPLIIILDRIGSLNFDIYTLGSILFLTINFIFTANMDKKSKNALRLLGKIHGFKKFLEVAEKHRIEMLVKENPSYCFDVLPYAYVLGVADEFIKRFEKLINCEYWSGRITPTVFNNFTSNCYSTTMPSAANGGVSSSSGGGGGGCSGGGGGGGGGGSW